jgi:hypothetical protein
LQAAQTVSGFEKLTADTADVRQLSFYQTAKPAVWQLEQFSGGIPGSTGSFLLDLLHNAFFSLMYL